LRWERSSANAGWIGEFDVKATTDTLILILIPVALGPPRIALELMIFSQMSDGPSSRKLWRVPAFFL
jgi:hypothetical protein